MDLSAIIKAVMEIGPDQPNRKAPPLRPGDLLTGKVVKLFADGQVVMDFGRFRARTKSLLTMQPGQQFTLEVVESGTPLKLRIRDDACESAKPSLPPLDQQGRMVSRFGESDPMLVITHHFYVEDQGIPVKLRVYYPKKGRKDRGAGLNRLAMLLNMDRLGPVRIDLAMFGDSLEVDFCVQSETARRILASADDQVKDALGKVYDRVQIVTRISEQKIAQFEQEDFSGSGSSMIDIQI